MVSEKNASYIGGQQVRRMLLTLAICGKNAPYTGGLWKSTPCNGSQWKTDPLLWWSSRRMPILVVSESISSQWVQEMLFTLVFSRKNAPYRQLKRLLVSVVTYGEEPLVEKGCYRGRGVGTGTKVATWPVFSCDLLPAFLVGKTPSRLEFFHHTPVILDGLRLRQDGNTHKLNQ